MDDLVVKMQAKCHRWRLVNQSNIKIDKNANISSRSIIEIKYGGKITIGNSEVLENVIIQTYGGNIVIGEKCSINVNTIIYGHGNTIIGNNVLIAGGCMIIPANHNFNRLDIPIRTQGLTTKGVIIENNVWIGHGCSILDGVTIGEGSVVAAGTVVNKSVPKNAIVAGVPSKIIKIRK